MVSAHDRAIPTEWPPSIEEDSFNFCGCRMSHEFNRWFGGWHHLGDFPAMIALCEARHNSPIVGHFRNMPLF
ncbi:unnamed protein product [Timema podura]|uniref:Uncharacterized protein n=1 Tax=Timema podura TaxID=61482 RepID=A0ABN7PB36_TIMPD|nr:unnamed protein product [Timema podura]